MRLKHRSKMFGLDLAKTRLVGCKFLLLLEEEEEKKKRRRKKLT
jgi:threonine aldolase